MKRTISLLSSAVLLGIIVATWYGCEKDSEETCEQDEICESKFVTACCTDEDDCVFKYNGKEYPSSQIDELAADLGCGGFGLVSESTSQKSTTSGATVKLKELLDKVRERL